MSDMKNLIIVSKINKNFNIQITHKRRFQVSHLYIIKKYININCK